MGQGLCQRQHHFEPVFSLVQVRGQVRHPFQRHLGQGQCQDPRRQHLALLHQDPRLVLVRLGRRLFQEHLRFS